MLFKLLKIGRSALVAATICAALAPTPSFAQTIDGDHTISADTKLTEDVTVNGQLILDGAAIDLNGHKLTVKGGFSATSTSTAIGTNIVGNPSFEQGFSTSGWTAWSDSSHPTDWTKTAGSVGSSRKNQPWVANVAIDGTYACYLQGGGTIQQNLDIDEAGYYEVSLMYASRKDQAYSGGIVTLSINGTTCYTDALVRLDTAVHTGKVLVRLDAGTSVPLVVSHAKNPGDSNSDQAIWVDAISVKKITGGGNAGIVDTSADAAGVFYVETTSSDAMAASATFYGGKTVYALAGDADWSAAGAINIPAGAAIDLNGHNLIVAGLTGDGVVIDTANEYYTLLNDDSRRLYMQLDYLASGTSVDSLNHGMEYIDTGYQHNTKTVVDMKVQILKTTTDWFCYYGARNGAANEFSGWIYRNNHWKGVSVDGDSGKPYPKNVPFPVHMEFNGTCTFGNADDSSTYLTFNSGAGGISSGRKDYLFALNQGSGNQFGANARIYYCTVKEKTAEAGVYDVKRDYVAAKRLSDGVLGMLDKKNGVFFTNKGGGAFIAGDYAVNAEAAEFGSSGVLRIAVPAGATLALDDMPKIIGDVKIIKEGAGVLAYNETTSSQKYFRGGYEDHSAPIIAVWTGDAGNNDFNDAANWSCTNDLGSALSGMAPDATTVKYILAADADWTTKGAISLGTGVTLDLNGNNLTAMSITGAGIVIDSSNNYYTTLKDASGNFYIQLEYIASSRTQYIDTGYRHNANTVVDMKVAITKTPNNDWRCYYGSRTGEGNQNELAGWIQNGYHWKGVAGVKGAETSWKYTENTPFLVHLDGAANATCSVDGHTFTHANALKDSGYNDTLFCGRQSSNNPFFPADARIYYCTIKDGEIVQRDFVAAKRLSDGVLGMLDKENGVFYTNKGSGAFIAGPYATNGSATGAGELHIAAAEGETAALGSMAKIVGGIKVVKEGAGAMTLPADGQYFAGGLEVAGGTLPMTQTAAFLAGTPITATAGGTIEVAAADGASYANDFTLAGGTLKVIASGSGNTTTATIAGTLALETGAADAQPVVSIDMTDCTSATFQLNTTALNVGSGVTAAPGFVSLADTTAYEASIVDGTAIKVEHLTSPATAVWTGLGEAGNFDDPGNWSCSNKYGVALANTTLPDNTTLTFRLGRDADWTAKGAIALAAGVKLDLNGRTLTAASITGDGVVTDSSADNVIVADDGSIYQKVKYVQATQDGANNSGGQSKIQYVDTEYYHIGTTKVDIRVEFQDVAVAYNSSGAWAVYYGCRQLDDANRAAQLGGWIHAGWFWYNEANASVAVKTGTIYDIRLDKNANAANYANYADGTLASTLGTGNGAGTSNTYGTDYIFANNQTLNGGKYWPCKCRVYSCKVYEGNEPKRDFVPVRCISGDKAGKAGFWCNVTKKFYGNSGYGDLTAGPLAQGETSGGELHITVAENATLSLANMSKIAGNVKIVKDGLGTLVAPTTGQYFTGGIEVQAGTLSMGGALSYGGAIDAASGTIVSVPASVGSAGTSIVNIAGGTFEVANCGTSVVTGMVTLGGNAISVAGSFAPVSGTAAHTITLADGATLDFTQWAGTFPVAYPTFAYASGANIILKLEPASTALTALARSKDAETGKRNGNLFSWDSPPTDVTFSSDAATRSRFRVVPDETGLCVSFNIGFSIIIM